MKTKTKKIIASMALSMNQKSHQRVYKQNHINIFYKK